MNLVPVRPPGPNARKARSFSSEILQLRVQGYTFEAIREALAAAGVHVSNSTVQREAARAARHPRATSPADDAEGLRRVVPLAPATSATALPVQPVSLPAPASPAIQRDARANTLTGDFVGKEGAEAFFNAHPSNPLFPAKESS